MHRLLIAVALLLLAPIAAAQVYTWKDASGTVHYSQEPPAQGTKFKEIKTTGMAAPLATPTPSQSSANADSAPPAAAADSATAKAPTQDSICSTLKANIATLQASKPVVMQIKGKITALDAAQRQQQLTSSQAQLAQFCPGK